MRCTPHQWVWLMWLILIIVVIAYFESREHLDPGCIAIRPIVLFSPSLLFAACAVAFAWRKSAATLQKHLIAYPFVHTFIYAAIGLSIPAPFGIRLDQMYDLQMLGIAGIMCAATAAVALMVWLLTIALIKNGWLVLREV